MLICLYGAIFVSSLLLLKIEKEKRYCISIIIFVSICYFTNEILSLFNSLDYKHLGGIYLFIVIFISAYTIKKVGIVNLKPEILKYIIPKINNKKIFVFFGVIFFIIFLLALFTVPYNWDSMTYHLPRIAQWAENKSVAHFVTGDVRQLTSPTLSEFVNLQVYIFSGQKDYFLNLLQYSCFFANTILVYYITKYLGGTYQYCWLASLLFVSMPIAFGEALNTQVDHFSTMWLLLFVYFLLELLEPNYCLKKNNKNIWRVIILSSCIGFGYLAKPSIMFGMFIFACWLLGVCIWRKDNMKDILFLICLAVGVITLIVMPEIMRNIISFGSISHSEAGAKQLIGTINPVYMFVNAVKNYAMNFPNIYINIGNLVEHGVYWIAYILNVNINHPSIAENGVEFGLHKAGEYGHDTAINPVIIIFMTIILLWLSIRRIKKEKICFSEIYSWVAISSFIVFTFVLRWEAYVTRYMLSYLALLCPVVVIWLYKIKKKEQSYAIMGIVVFLSIIELFNLLSYHGEICIRHNNAEDREYNYFEVYKEDREYFVKLERILGELEFESVGLYLSIANTYEYPIWAMLDKSVRIEHILVDNETKKYEDNEFVPEIIIVMRKNEEEVINYKGKNYYCYEMIDDNKSVWVLQDRKGR